MLKFLHSWCTHSSLYGLTLRKSIRGRLRPLPQDNWPAASRNVSNFVAGFYQVDKVTLTVTEILKSLGSTKTDVHAVCLHSFDFLRDLQAVGDNNSRRFARHAISHWIDHHSQWRKKPWLSWDLDILGYRLCHWMGFYEFFAHNANQPFQKKLIISIGQQYRYLKRRYKSLKDPVVLFRALKGLIYTGCAFPREQNKLSRWVMQLQHCLKSQFDQEYNHKSRHAGTVVLLLKDLIDLRQLLRHYYAGSIDFITEYIEQLAPAIRHFRHGDGELTKFSGAANVRLEAFCSTTISNALIDMVLSLADIKAKLPKSPTMGYARCANKSSLMLVNLQPTLSYTNLNDWYSQATGIGEYEWSQRAQRLIMRGDVGIYLPHAKCLLTSRHLKPESLQFNLIHENDHSFLSIKYQIEQKFLTQPTACGYATIKRELCIFPNGDLRGEEEIKTSSESQIFIRFLAAENMLWNTREGIFLRPSLENKNTNDYEKRLLYQGADQPQVVEVDQYHALCLHAKSIANHSLTIKWALSKANVE